MILRGPLRKGDYGSSAPTITPVSSFGGLASFTRYRYTVGGEVRLRRRRQFLAFPRPTGASWIGDGELGVVRRLELERANWGARRLILPTGARLEREHQPSLGHQGRHPKRGSLSSQSQSTVKGQWITAQNFHQAILVTLVGAVSARHRRTNR